MQSFNNSLVRWTAALLLTTGIASCAHPGSDTFAAKAAERTNALEAQTYVTRAAPRPELGVSILNTMNNRDLTRYLREVLDNNRDLKALAATVQAYEYGAKVVSGQRAPSVDLNINQQREKTFETRNSSSASLDVHWAVDVWGKLSDETQAARLTVDQQRLQHQNAQNVVLAQAVQGWLSLWSLQAQLQLIAQQNALAETQTTTVQERYESGQTSFSQLSEYRVSAKHIEQEKIRTESRIRIELQRLNVLRGQVPSAPLELSDSAVSPTFTTLPDQISALTLLERPDIQAAFREIEILDAQTKAANKALLPQLTISGNIGRTGETLANLVNGDLIWQLVGGLTQPIFRGGQLRNEAKRASKQAEVAFYRYEQTVLGAMQEVENGLSHETALLQQIESTRSRVEETNKQMVSIEQAYLSGNSDILVLFDARSRQLEARREWRHALAAYLSNRVTLALALGHSFSESLLSQEVSR